MTIKHTVISLAAPIVAVSFGMPLWADADASSYPHPSQGFGHELVFDIGPTPPVP
jgi:hypothetical protein